jgi:hypothetical protein
MIPPKREVEHKIQLLFNSPFLNIGMYRQFFLEANEVKHKLQQLLEKGLI